MNNGWNCWETMKIVCSFTVLRCLDVAVLDHFSFLRYFIFTLYLHTIKWREWDTIIAPIHSPLNCLQKLDCTPSWSRLLAIQMMKTFLPWTKICNSKDFNKIHFPSSYCGYTKVKWLVHNSSVDRLWIYNQNILFYRLFTIYHFVFL